MLKEKTIITPNPEISLFRDVMNDEEKKNTIGNIIGAMKGISGPKKDQIVNRQLCHFFRADVNLGTAIAKGLDVNIDAVMKEMKHESVHA